jgi:hypothetical protein
MKKSDLFKEIVENRRSNRHFSPDIEVPDETVLSALSLPTFLLIAVICNFGDFTG